MDFFFNTLKRVLTFTLTVAVVTVFTYLPQEYGDYDTVPEAEAFLGGIVFDPSNFAQTTVTAANSLSIFSKEFVLDNLAWILAKSVISNMVASTVTWINSGFEGSPAFVQDLDRYLVNVADETAGAFIQSLGPNNPLSFLCSPFALDIQIALALQYDVARERQPYRGCQISDFTGDFERFIDGEFSQGGWEDWFRVVAQPEVYTPIGGYLAAQQALQQNIQAEQAAENQTVANGNGFMSLRVCSGATGPGGTSTAGPGGFNGGGGVTGDGCRVVTPGSVFADRINTTLGISEQTLINADEINEIVGALMSQLAVQAVSGSAGLLGLSQGTGFTYSGFNGGSFVDALQQQGTDNVNNNFGGSVQDLEEILDRQQAFLATTRTYNQQFSAISSQFGINPDPDEEAAVNSALQETESIILKLNLELIPTLTNDINEYRSLSQQLASGQLSPTEETTVRNQQIAVLNRVNSAGHYQPSQINSFIQRWDLILDSL
jgi:hypothetical protein